MGNKNKHVIIGYFPSKEAATEAADQPGDETYFWRHADRAGTACPARFVAARKKPTIKQP